MRLRGRILCADVELAGEAGPERLSLECLEVDPENSVWTFDRARMELQADITELIIVVIVGHLIQSANWAMGCFAKGMDP